MVSSGNGVAPGPGTPGPGQAHQAFDSLVRWTIEVERGAAADFLPEAERGEFLKYYERLPAATDEVSIRRYLRGMWRGEAGWTARWIAARSAIAPPVRVLDAGSGFGTFAMLYAAVGAEVVGVDLRPDRLSAADRRLEYFASRTGRSLNVHCQRADLTREWPGDFDVVWVYNALSHIDPLDAFLDQTRRHLRPGGVLVVGDINGANSAHLKRLGHLRTDVHQEYVAPDGERHAYAVERPFPPEELRGIMASHGLKVVRHELYWFGLSVLPDLLYWNLLAPLQTGWQLGERVARRQLLVATPSAPPALHGA